MATTDYIITTLLNVKLWPDTLRDRKTIDSFPAVYALTLDQRFPRLVGTSRVLYIGQTGQLGGNSDRSRLYGHTYPSGKHGRLLRSRLDHLISLGHEITFRWLIAADEEESRYLERSLLHMHITEHLEFPPFNGKS